MMLSVLALLFAVTAAAAKDTRQITVALRQHNMDKLQELVLDISNPHSANYGNYLSTAEVNAIVSPPASVRESVTSELERNGILCLSLGDALRCQETESGAIRSYFQAGNGVYSIPSAIAPHVVFVEGLRSERIPDEVQPMKSKSRVPAPTVDAGYTGREVLARLYNITNVRLDNRTGLGSIEYQGQSGFSQDDLRASQKGNSEAVNPVAPNHILGANTDPDTETELDMQMQSQLGNGAALWYDGSHDWLYSWAVAFFNTVDIPYIVSHSWGWAYDQQCTIDVCNNETSTEYVDRVNNEYMKLAARGVTMTVASGDSGAPGRSNLGCQVGNRTVVPIFPGSSPWVVSVGATYVVANSTPTNVSFTSPLCKVNQCATGTTEATVMTDAVGWTAGGGFGVSPTEYRPAWQASAVQDYLVQGLPLPKPFNHVGRGYPDVAVIGHNCPTYEGDVGQVDGTSCSSPTFSAILGILNAHQASRGKPRLGFVNPVLYSMYYDDPSIYNDITTGHNWCTEAGCCPTRKDGGSDFGYLAAPGWDPVTGLGSVHVDRMLAWLDKNL